MSREPEDEIDVPAALALARATTAAPPPGLRERVLAFGDVPQGPIDPSRYAWVEVVPGVRAHVLHEDGTVRKALIWADPGAVHPAHRHLGLEEILVLQGGLRDEHGDYGPGDILRSEEGSVHSEEALPGEDCFCFVISHGGHERLSE